MTTPRPPAARAAPQVLLRVSLAALVALPAVWVLTRPADAVGVVPTTTPAAPAPPPMSADAPSPSSAARERWSRAADRAAAGLPVPRQAVAAAGGSTSVPVAEPTPSPQPTPAVATHPARIAEVAAPAPVPPTRVRIPALGVDAPVVPIGVEPTGAVAVPEDVGVVGWYRHGPAPGAAAGSTMLTAHVDGDGVTGAFFALAQLSPGAELAVDAADGTTHDYRVVARRAVHKDDLPAETVFAEGGPAVLTLVTCGGPFDPATRSYRDNVVVTAVPVTATGAVD